MKKLINKKYLISLIIVLLFNIFLFNNALAQPAANNKTVTGLLQMTGDTANYNTKEGANSPPTLIGNIIGVFLSVLGIIFMVIAIYAGFLWMTAKGNEEQAAKAKDLLRDAVIGVIIVISAYAVTYFVLYVVARNYVEKSGF